MTNRDLGAVLYVFHCCLVCKSMIKYNKKSVDFDQIGVGNSDIGVHLHV